MAANRIDKITVNNTKFLNNTCYVEGAVFMIFSMKSMSLLNSQFIGNLALQTGGVIS